MANGSTNINPYISAAISNLHGEFARGTQQFLKEAISKKKKYKGEVSTEFLEEMLGKNIEAQRMIAEDTKSKLGGFGKLLKVGSMFGGPALAFLTHAAVGGIEAKHGAKEMERKLQKLKDEGLLKLSPKYTRMFTKTKALPWETGKQEEYDIMEARAKKAKGSIGETAIGSGLKGLIMHKMLGGEGPMEATQDPTNLTITQAPAWEGGLRGMFKGGFFEEDMMKKLMAMFMTLQD